MRITWTCDTCGQPILRGAGYVCVSHDEIARRDEAYAAWKDRTKNQRAVSLDQLLTIPDLARWSLHHDVCRPEGTAHEYAIGLERMATHRDVLKRTAHLMEKNWLKATNWPEVIRQATN